MKNVTFKTRHALVLSCISLMTCFAMLLGTTFAWFTDSVTSGVNRIVSGNLDVTLTHKGAEANATEQNVNENTKLFVSTLGDYLLWEPEAMSYETFTVGNAGTLALKYQLALVNAGNNTVTRDSTTKSLLDVIKVAVINDATNGITRELIKTKATMTLKDFIGSVNNTSGILYPSTDTDTNHAKTRTFTVALYWPQSEGDNFYNLKDGKLANDGGKELYVDLGITLVATQVQNESDSFGPNYDANSTYPSATVQGTAATVTTNSATTTATTNNNTVTATATVAAVPADNSSESTTVTLTAAESGAAFSANDTLKLDVTTTNAIASNSTITVSSTDAESKTAVASIDLTLTKITTTEAGTTETALTRGFTAEVTTYIAKGLSDVSVKYNGTGEEPTDVTYEASTGKLTFKTTHFSEYYVTASNEAYIAETDTAYPTLSAAVEAAQDGETVVLLKDVTTTEQVKIEKSLNINGNEKTVTLDLIQPTAGVNSRVFLVNGEGITVNVKNLTATNKETKSFYNSSVGSTYYPIGIAIDGDGNNVTLDKVNVSANWYAVNSFSTTSNLKLNIKNASVSAGWAALNLWGANGKVVASDSTFSGNNNKTYNADGWNNFSTLVINGTAENMAFSFANCTINAMQSTGNRQTVLSLRSSGANVKFENCTITYQESEKFPCAFYDEAGYSNTLKVVSSTLNGDALAVDQTSPAPNVWYSNGSFTNPPDGAMNTFFPSPFESGWMANNEGIKLLSNVELSGDVTCKLEEGTIYVYFEGHSVSGGQLILQGTTSVISDNGNMSEVFGGGIITVVDNNDGTYTYSLSANPT